MGFKKSYLLFRIQKMGRVFLRVVGSQHHELFENINKIPSYVSDLLDQFARFVLDSFL